MSRIAAGSLDADAPSPGKAGMPAATFWPESFASPIRKPQNGGFVNGFPGIIYRYTSASTNRRSFLDRPPTAFRHPLPWPRREITSPSFTAASVRSQGA